MRELVGIDAVAAAFSVSRQTVLKWKDAHDIPYYQIGKTLRFDLAEVMECARGRRDAKVAGTGSR